MRPSCSGFSFGNACSRPRSSSSLVMRTSCAGATIIPLRDLQHQRVDIAPAPVLAGLEGCDDRMTGMVEMPRCVAVLRIVAATDVAAGPADAQVDPGIAGGEALFASIGPRFVRAHLVEMSAACGHSVVSGLRLPCREQGAGQGGWRRPLPAPRYCWVPLPSSSICRPGRVVSPPDLTVPS